MLQRFILSVARGFAMGAADIVPGVSGGTIALVVGIYERLIASVSAGSSAIGRILKGDVAGSKQAIGNVEWSFLIPLGGGVLLAIVTLAHIIEDLLHDQPVLMASLFVGLVAGSIVIATGMIKRPATMHLGIVVGVGVVVFVLLGVRSGTSEETVSQIADPALWALFGSGALAICAMILPGISGSFILVMLGMYGAVLGAVTDLDIGALGVFSIGAVAGLAVFSQFLNWSLRTHHDIVLAGLIGLMVGSLRVLWPWPLGVDSTVIASPDSQVPAAIVMAIIGFAAVAAIAWLANRLDTEATASTDVAGG